MLQLTGVGFFTLTEPSLSDALQLSTPQAIVQARATDFSQTRISRDLAIAHQSPAAALRSFEYSDIDPNDFCFIYESTPNTLDAFMWKDFEIVSDSLY